MCVTASLSSMTGCLFERRQQIPQPFCELKQPIRSAVNEYLNNPGVPRCEIMTSRGPPKPVFPWQFQQS
jgi:hypothetical protein